MLVSFFWTQCISAHLYNYYNTTRTAESLQWKNKFNIHYTVANVGDVNDYCEILFVFRLLSVSVFLFVASDVAGVIGCVFTAGDTLSFSFFVKSLLVAARVLGRVCKTVNCRALYCFLLHRHSKGCISQQ